MSNDEHPTRNKSEHRARNQTEDSWLAKLLSKLKDGILTTIATGVASGVAAALLAAWVLVATLPGRLGLTPTGAVLAFDLSGGCPSGWESYDNGNGRFLIGAATVEQQAKTPGNFVRDARGIDLVARSFGMPGGAQTALLAKESIPPLYLKFHSQLSGPDRTVSTVEALTFDKPNVQPYLQTSDKDAQPFGIMPPYIALHFCRKT